MQNCIYSLFSLLHWFIFNNLSLQNRIQFIHSWHGFSENGPRRNIAQLLKLFSYITIRILKISFRNCVSSLLSTHYRTFFLQAHSIWPKSRAFNPTQKLIGTTKFYCDSIISNIIISLKINSFFFATTFCYTKRNEIK
jgi:hypothetical protein